MSSAKYIGLDVHQATTVAAVLDSNGKLVMEAIVETQAATVIQFIRGISGEVHVTLEEGTCWRSCYVPTCCRRFITGRQASTHYGRWRAATWL
jgi:hypothetical protein